MIVASRKATPGDKLRISLHRVVFKIIIWNRIKILLRFSKRISEPSFKKCDHLVPPILLNSTVSTAFSVRRWNINKLLHMKSEITKSKKGNRKESDRDRRDREGPTWTNTSEILNFEIWMVESASIFPKSRVILSLIAYPGNLCRNGSNGWMDQYHINGSITRCSAGLRTCDSRMYLLTSPKWCCLLIECIRSWHSLHMKLWCPNLRLVVVLNNQYLGRPMW